ncbi:hypothetical protein MAHJHV63_19140 [Mycobacterium avium subsp. hominissuis]
MLTCEVRESALSRLGRALADPTRCRILVALLDGVCYPGQLASHLGLTRSNVSNHLSCLRGCGLVIAAYEGRQVRYALADSHLARALSELVQVRFPRFSGDFQTRFAVVGLEEGSLSGSEQEVPGRAA